VWKPPFEWGQLIRLKKFECIVQHCERGIKRCILAPINERGVVPDWYKGNVKKIEEGYTSLRAEIDEPSDFSTKIGSKYYVINNPTPKNH
jgi:hypothetical protein